MFLFWEDRRKRVPKTKRQLLLERQKGKCAGCKKSFKRMRVKPVLHHIGKSNRIDMMELLCPNCHSKAHTYKTKTDSWGDKETVLVKKRLGKAPKRKKGKRKKSKKDDDWFW